jgi:methylated-DNA-[protein]-cysteine S-methyltransferase
MEHIDETTFTVATPLGPLTLRVKDGAVCRAAFRAGPGDPPRQDPLAAALSVRVRAYFAGEADALEGVIVEPEGTPFEREVWEALRRIPAGESRNYGALARALGQPGAARAVGRACALNPVALLVPCHRVVGADGVLTGYAWGIERKRWLLAHEAGRQGRIAGACSASAGPSPSSSPR